MSGARVGILGLGRSGVAAVRLALHVGNRVYACDESDKPATLDHLSALSPEAVTIQLGGVSREELAACDVIVVSPGVGPSSAAYQAARRVGRPLISEIEFAFRNLGCHLIAVTGTNGKSTTSALISHLLEVAGLVAPAAGNIGLPLSEIAMRSPLPDWAVVEVSSYQLAHVERFAPSIGVVTNLAPDHLDRYPSVDAYYADKARLFDNARPDDVWVLNAEDAAVRALPGRAAGERRYFSTAGPLVAGETGAYLEADTLVLRRSEGDIPLVGRAELALLGDHNVANALAGVVATSAAAIPAGVIAAGLRGFKGLPHRLEVVVERGGVLWINDSKATNVASTRVALESMNRPTVVLLGGRHKGESYASLIPALARHARYVLAYGEAGEQIEAELSGGCRVERVGGSFEDVVERAAEIAAFGDVVLLSPACASFDMFRDFEDRGTQFKRLAIGHAKVTSG